MTAAKRNGAIIGLVVALISIAINVFSGDGFATWSSPAGWAYNLGYIFGAIFIAVIIGIGIGTSIDRLSGAARPEPDKWTDLEAAVAGVRAPDPRSSGKRSNTYWLFGTAATVAVFAVAFMAMKYIVGGHYHKSQVLDGAAIISGRDRADFIKGAVSTCKKTQLAHPDNKGLSEQIIARYCECIADGMAATVTNMEMHAFSGTITQELQAKINKAAAPCYPK